MEDYDDGEDEEDDKDDEDGEDDEDDEDDKAMPRAAYHDAISLSDGSVHQDEDGEAIRCNYPSCTVSPGGTEWLRTCCNPGCDGRFHHMCATASGDERDAPACGACNFGACNFGDPMDTSVGQPGTPKKAADDSAADDSADDDTAVPGTPATPIAKARATASLPPRCRITPTLTLTLTLACLADRHPFARIAVPQDGSGPRAGG